MGKITLIDEEDIECEFELLATFGLDDYNYAALMPIDRIDEEVHILRIEQDNNGDTMLLGIEDSRELDDAITAYESLVNENNEIK